MNRKELYLEIINILDHTIGYFFFSAIGTLLSMDGLCQYMHYIQGVYICLH